MSSIIFLSLIIILILTTLNVNVLKCIKTKLCEATVFFILLLLFALIFNSVSVFTNVNFIIIKGFWIVFLVFQLIWFIFNLFIFRSVFLNSLSYKLVALILSFVFYHFFFNYGQIQSLLPLTEVSFGLSSGFDAFVNSSINFDLGNTFYIFFASFIRSFFGNVAVSTFIPTIVKVIQLCFNYCLISLVIDQIKKNYSFNKLYLSGFILACSFLYSYEAGSFGYSINMWNVLFIFQFFVLLHSKSNINLLLCLILALNIFTLNGVNLQSLIAVLILNLVALEIFAENKEKFSIILNLFLILLSIITFVYMDCNLTDVIQLLIKPSSTNFTLSYLSLDLKTICIVVVIIFTIFVSMLKGKFLYATMTMAFFANPLILNYFSDNTALLLLIVSMLFTPSFVGMNVENLKAINISDFNLVFCTLLLASWTTTEKLLLNPYYESADLDATYRIDKDELDIYMYLYGNYDFSKEINVISQAKLSNVFLPNSNVVDLYRDQLSRCQYCDVLKDNIHEPNKLINIFAYREFGGNRLFIEKPEYSEVNSILDQYKINLLVLRKDQTIEVDGKWINLYEYLAKFTNLSYENDKYALLLK